MVWSKAKGCYVVVSELAKQNGKNKYGQTGETTGLLSALLCALMLTGSALFWPMEVSAGTQYGDDSRRVNDQQREERAERYGAGERKRRPEEERRLLFVLPQ